MYKTTNTLPQKIRSKSVAALLAGLVALTALPLTASADTPHGVGVTVGEIRDIVAKYLSDHPELRQAAAAPHVHGIYVGDSEHQNP